MCDLLFVFFLLRVVDRHLTDEEVTWIAVLRLAPIIHVEVLAHLVCLTLINDVAV